MPHVELPQAEFKVVMLGDTNTGKTSLVLRFAEGYYREEARSATVGAFFITKRLQVQGITCKIQIWDTAGQEQFKCMAPMYYRNAAAAIVCYDVTCPSSYTTMRFWLDELHRNIPAGNIVICIAATKTDLIPAVDLAQAEQMATSMGAMFVDTSAKTNTNVISLFRKVAERVLQFKQDTPIPVTSGAAVDEHGNVSRKAPHSKHQGLVSSVTPAVLDTMTAAPSATPLVPHATMTTTAATTTTATHMRRDKRTKQSQMTSMEQAPSFDVVESKSGGGGGVMCMENPYFCGQRDDVASSCIIS
jgi:small GTP-binding protein